MKILYIILLALLGSSLFAQPGFKKKWDYTYGGNVDDYLESLINTKDGGFMLGGWSRSDKAYDISQPNCGVGTGFADFWIVKTNSAGVKQWDKRYGGCRDERLFGLVQTADGGYVLAGWSESDSGFGLPTEPKLLGNFWVVKVDSTGKKIWDKRHKGEVLNAMIPTRDHGYLLGGYISRFGISDTDYAVNGYYDYWAVKIDSNGNKQWNVGFGSKGFDQITCLAQTSDGGYILGGKSDSLHSGAGSPWTIKVDSLGKVMWDYLSLDAITYLYDIEEANDGGIIFVGGGFVTWGYGSSDLQILKTNSIGVKEWAGYYGGSSVDGYEASITKTTDGGYLLLSQSSSQKSGLKSENNYGGTDPWLLKIDGLGHLVWEKTVFAPADDNTLRVVVKDDSSYVVATSIQTTGTAIGGYKSQANKGWTNYWIVNLTDTTALCQVQTPNIIPTKNSIYPGDSAEICAPLGFSSYHWNNGWTKRCIKVKSAGSYFVIVGNGKCIAESNKVEIVMEEPTGINEEIVSGMIFIYPNPVRNSLTVECLTQGSTIIISNLLGEVLINEKTISGKKEINVSHLPSGMYFVNNKKFIKE